MILYFFLPVRKPLELDFLAHWTLDNPYPYPSPWHSLQSALHTMMTNDRVMISWEDFISFRNSILPKVFFTSLLRILLDIRSLPTLSLRKTRRSFLNRCLLFFEIFDRSDLQTLVSPSATTVWSPGDVFDRKSILGKDTNHSNAPILKPMN